MDEVIPSSSEWLQYHYQEEPTDELPYGGLSDAMSSYGVATHDTMLCPSSTGETMTMLATENSSAATSDLSPKASIGKPVRKRSRASRRTPATLLNASIQNFRNLVQQYTGFQSVGTPIKSHKGPINLSFGSTTETNDSSQYDQDRYQSYHQEHIQHYQGGQQGLPSFGENTCDQFSSAFSNSGQNMVTVNNFGWH